MAPLGDNVSTHIAQKSETKTDTNLEKRDILGTESDGSRLLYENISSVPYACLYLINHSKPLILGTFKLPINLL